MIWQLASFVSFVALSSCGPPLVWGDDDKVEKRLLTIVPVGSSLAKLEDEAQRRGWDIRFRSSLTYAAGSKTNFDDTHLICRGQGGVQRTSILAQYPSPFTTTVEAMWLFDRQGALKDICIRRTTDAL